MSMPGTALERDRKHNEDIPFLDEFLFRLKFLHELGVYPEPSSLIMEGPGQNVGWLDFDDQSGNKKEDKMKILSFSAAASQVAVSQAAQSDRKTAADGSSGRTDSTPTAVVIPKLEIKYEKEEEALRAIIEQLNARIEHLQGVIASIKNKEMSVSKMQTIIKKLMYPMKPADLISDESSMSSVLTRQFNEFILEYQSFVKILNDGDVDAAYVVIKRRHRTQEMFSLSGLANGTVMENERNFMSRLLGQLHPLLSEDLIYMFDKEYFCFEGKDLRYKNQKFSQEQIVDPWNDYQRIQDKFQISKVGQCS